MKAKTTTGKLVTVEVIKSAPRKRVADSIRYRTYDGQGNRTILTGDKAMEIHRKTF